MMFVVEGTLVRGVNVGEGRRGIGGVKRGRVVAVAGKLVKSANGGVVCKRGAVKLNIGAGITCTKTGCGAAVF